MGLEQINELWLRGSTVEVVHEGDRVRVTHRWPTPSLAPIPIDAGAQIYIAEDGLRKLKGLTAHTRDAEGRERLANIERAVERARILHDLRTNAAINGGVASLRGLARTLRRLERIGQARRPSRGQRRHIRRVKAGLA